MTDDPNAPPKRGRNQYTKAAAQPVQPEVPEKTGRNKDGTFVKGVSPNPNGRPKGALNHSTRAVLAMMQGEAEAITRRAIDLALAGDSVAMRLVMERLVSPVRERPVNLAMPKINAASDLIAVAAALTEAAASGEITPGEAASLSVLVGNVAKAVETVEIVARLAKLEEQLSAKGNNP